MQYSMGFHVWGHSPGFSGADANRVVCSTMDPIMGTQADVDTSVRAPPPGSLFVLGPYKTKDARYVAIKCITHETLQNMGSTPGIQGNGPGNLGQALINWNHTDDTAVPTPEMIKHAIDVLQREGLPPLQVLNICYTELVQRERERRTLVRMCEEDPSLMRKVRVITRLFWMYAMYLRRWKGPGTPYPVNAADTRTRVTWANMSPDLKHKMVAHGATGVRLTAVRPGTRRSNAIPADSINDDGRLDGMETQIQHSLRSRFDALTAREQEAVKAGFRIAHIYRMVDDSGFYVKRETLFDACFGGGYSLAMGNRCVRLTSLGMLGGTLTMGKLLFRTPPTWMLYEGSFAQIS